MKLQQLRYFKAVCELGSVSAAAENLFISQSAISISIKELEGEFNLVLFQRVGKRLVLTQEGRHLLNLSTRLLQEADYVQQTMKDLSLRHRPIRLGMTTMMAAILLPQIFSEMAVCCPEIKLQVIEGGRGELAELLSKQKVDLIIISRISNAPADDCYNNIPILTMQYGYCVNKSHRLAGRDKVSVNDIGNDPLVTFTDGYSQKTLTISRFNEQGLVPNIVHSSAQLSTILEMVDKNGMGCFLYKDLEKLRPDLKFIPFDPDISLQVDLEWRKDIVPSQDLDIVTGCISKMFISRNPQSC